MKRYGVVCLAVLIAAAALSAQTITVKQPSPGDIWIKGEMATIFWTHSGTLPANVRISLRNADSTVEVLVIAETAPNMGASFGPWVPPASLPDGSYVIRVKAKGVATHGDSVPFGISVKPEIHITSPREGALWTRKAAVAITWNKVGLLPHVINIDLYNPASGRHSLIAVGQRISERTYSWVVPSDFPLGDSDLTVWTPLNPKEDSAVIIDKHKVKILLGRGGSGRL